MRACSWVKRLLTALTLSLAAICTAASFGNFEAAYAATTTTMATGLSAPIGLDIDESKNKLYYVEYGSGSLKRINLPPTCGISGMPACSTTIQTIAAGLSHPEDVKLDLAHGFAYVTTRDDSGTTGMLWRVTIATGAKNAVSINLGAPQQLVLDVPNNSAYAVGYDDGRLRRIDLVTGAKTVLYSGLNHPIGLVLTADRKYAYISEQGAPAVISRIDLISKAKTVVIQDGVSGVSLINPFFMAWNPGGEDSLFIAERDPANRLSRLDIAARAKYEVATGLPFRPSGVAVGSIGTSLYVSTNNELVKVYTGLVANPNAPGFMGIGRVPFNKIINGYATTGAGDPIQVTHAPFGGTLDMFGNLSNFKNMGAYYYEIEAYKNGVFIGALNSSWNTYKWDTASLQYKSTPVAPVSGTTRYQIPTEYPVHPEYWYPSFLMMRWPSGTDGTYRFKIKLYSSVSSVTPISPSIPSLYELTVVVDSTPIDVKINAICQSGGGGSAGSACYPDKEVKACDIVSAAPNSYYFKITANDPNGHLLNYAFTAMWGDNKSERIFSDNYQNHIAASPPHIWGGVINFKVPSSSWSAHCNCAHTFYLDSWKRTIDGYNHLLYYSYHKSATINNAGTTCSP